MKFVKAFCGYCSVWEVGCLILEIKMGLRHSWWCQRWSQEGWRRKSLIHSLICIIMLPQELLNTLNPKKWKPKHQKKKKKKKRGVREANKTRHSNNRSKRCEIWKLLPTDHMENAVKCRKYLSDWLLKLRMREEFKGRSMQQCISFNVRVTQRCKLAELRSVK